MGGWGDWGEGSWRTDMWVWKEEAVGGVWERRRGRMVGICGWSQRVERNIEVAGQTSDALHVSACSVRVSACQCVSVHGLCGVCR